jgi:hypothetical protein
VAPLKPPVAWLIAAAAACAVFGIAHLPPRGSTRDPRETQAGLMTGPPTSERLRANEIAKEWRRASLDVRLHEWRLQLAPDLNRLRAANQPTLVTSIDTTWPREVREHAASAIVAAWQSLGLGTTKIGVAVVIEVERITAAVPARTHSAYLLPDSADRTTCVAWIAPTGLNRALLERSGEQYARALVSWTRRLLGPCAFYADFGRPSMAMERWLAARQYRFAQAASWDSLTIRYDLPWYGQAETQSQRAQWAQWAYRQYSRVGLGCMAERITACRDAAVGVVPTSGAVPRLVVRSGDVATDLPGSTLLLAEMVHEFGSARFGRFWISDLAPDSAFHLAMDTTLGDWVLSRQRAYGTTLAAGPTPSLFASAFGLGVAALALALAVAAAIRRQVA